MNGWRMVVVAGMIGGTQVSCRLPDGFSGLGSNRGWGLGALDQTYQTQPIDRALGATRGGLGDGLRSRPVVVAMDRRAEVPVSAAERRMVAGGRVVAVPVKNKDGYVYSPFAKGGSMVDVRKFRAGQEALCPYTMKRFVVPGSDSRAPVPTGPSPTVPLVVKTEVPKREFVRERTPRWGRLVVATPVEEKSGYVYSPYTEGRRMIDVRKFKAGQEALCPYTMKRFVVPDEGLVKANVAKLRQEQLEASRRGAALQLGALPQIASTGGDVRPMVGGASRGAPNLPVPQTSPSVATGVDVAREPKVELPSSAPSKAGLPTGSWVEGRPGFVSSPYAKSYQLVDVTGIAAGTEVKCPYTGKNFLVPGFNDRGEPAPTTPEPTVEPVPLPKKGELPTAAWAEGSPGYVQTPFGKKGQLVDVTGFSAGTVVECPFTHQDFRVPAAR